MWIIAMAVTCTDSSITAMDQQFAMLISRYTTSEVNSFPLSVKLLSDFRVSRTANCPRLVVRNDVLVFFAHKSKSQSDYRAGHFCPG